MYDGGMEYRNDANENTIDLYGIAEDVGKHWLSVLLLSLAALMFAYVFFSATNKGDTYTSSATIAVANTDFGTNVETNTSITYSTDVTKKLVSVIASNEYKAVVAARLGYPDFVGDIKAERFGDSNIIRIAVTSAAPLTSYDEVRGILENLKESEKRLIGGTRITVFEYPVIQSKDAVYRRNLERSVLAALAVCILVIGVLTCLSLRRDTIHSGIDVVNKLGTECLGSIAHQKRRAEGSDKLITDPSADLAYTEGIRRTAIRISRRMDRKGQKVLLVTSARDGEGKAEAAANIALAMAQQGAGVILADMDFNGPSLKNILKVERDEGENLDSFLEKHADSSAEEIETDAGQLLHKIPDCGLSLIMAGEKGRYEADRYSEAVKKLLQALRNKADYVVISAGPAGESLDTEMMAAACDTSVMVIRRNMTDTREIAKAIGLMGGREHVLGCVVSDARHYNMDLALSKKKDPKNASEKKDLVESVLTEEIEIDLARIFRKWQQEVCRSLIAIAAAMLLFGGLFCLPLVGKGGETKGYSAYSTFTVEPTGTVHYRVGSQKHTSTFAIGKVVSAIAPTDAMAILVKNDLGLPAQEPLPAVIEAVQVKGSNMIRLTVTSEEEQTAVDVRQSVMRCFEVISDASVGHITIAVINEGVTEASQGAASAGGIKRAAAGMLVGLVIALLVLMVRAICKETILAEEDIVKILGSTCIGSVPWIKSKGSGKGAESLLSVSSDTSPEPFRNAVHRLRYRVEKEAEKDGNKVILVTSSIPSEGKTTIAANLALSLADRRKVLLIDGDLRDPAAMKALGMAQSETGLSGCLAGTCTADKILLPYEKNGNLTILPAGKTADCPAVLWGGAPAKDLMRKLREEYDFIVIDAPQSAVVSESAMIADLADACLYVIRQSFARINEICEGMEILEDTDCRLLGCVMRN